jgi:hypothetical protein
MWSDTLKLTHGSMVASPYLVDAVVISLKYTLCITNTCIYLVKMCGFFNSFGMEVSH